ncbi:hypothetical protein EBT25_17825, partial [bacterium]|nr:hypothetical protein [bacterium]
NGGPLAGTRNRIINGDMRIDQRNAGASVNTNGSYPVDRFRQDFAGGGVITAQRSTTAPAGFTNSVSLTVSTADSSIAAGDYYLLQHRIEGFNTADFGFGAAGAATVTMSFWARSSVTGTYGAALHNDNDTRAYVFTYTINAVNTWEYKTITIAGDTTGTWSTGNTTGISIIFDFGSGTNFNGTAGTWAGSNVFRTSGCVNWIANSGATFYITGVQLEPGTVATLFERIDYSESLRRCQRYYQVLGPSDTLTTGTTICVMPQAGTGAVNENWGHLSGNLYYAFEFAVRSRFTLIVQDDLMFINDLPIRKIISTMENHSKIKHVRFNRRSNIVLGRDTELTQIKSGDLFFLKTNNWSDNNHITTSDYYRKIVFPQIDNKKT